MLAGEKKNLFGVLIFFVLGFAFGFTAANWKHDCQGEQVPVNSPESIAAVTGSKSFSISISPLELQKQANSNNTSRMSGVFKQKIARLSDRYEEIVSGESEIAVILEKIDSLEPEELLGRIKNYTNISPHDIPAQVDVHDFATRLGEIYSRNEVPEDEQVDDANLPQVSSIEFDFSTLSNNMVYEPKDHFTGDTRRIFASFKTSNYTNDKVMVKWSRQDSPEVFIYEKYSINPNTDHNYIWLDRPHGWDNGDYQVEIYSMEDNLSLFAQGGYSVVTY